MKNIYLVSLLSLAVAGSAQAQTITRSNLPEPGDMFEGIIIATEDDSWDPGQAGDGQVWDFSARTGDAAPFEYTPVTDEVFSGSQMKMSLGIMGDAYFAASESDYRLTGMTSSLFESYEINIPYQDHQVLFRFPMMYGASFKDTAKAEYTEEQNVDYSGFKIDLPVTTKRVIFSETVVDSRGTLILQDKEYHDVLRVKVVSKIKDTASATHPFAGTFVIGTPNSTLEEYYFFSEDYKHQLAHFIRLSTDRGKPAETPFVLDYIFLFPSASLVTSMLDGKTNDNMVYPNPAQDRINFNLKNATSIELFDMKGRRITSGPLSDGARSLDISVLNPGLYTYRISTESGEVLTGKVTVR